MNAPLSRRGTLLAHNAGTWEGTFVRFDGCGKELERFGSHLAVSDHNGTIEAALTNRTTGQVRTMAFQEPPAEMQITPAGQWSLGPDRIGPWPWVSELCLVWGEQRRRAIIRHNSSGLQSLVLVVEGRPQLQSGLPPAPPAPLQLIRQDLGRQQSWSLGDLVVISQADRQESSFDEGVGLRWQPTAGLQLQIERRYSPAGLLEPLLS